MRRTIMGSLLVSLPLLSLLSSWYQWQIYYLTMRANLYGHYMPMHRLENLAHGIPWIPHMLCAVVILTLCFWPQMRATLRGWTMYATITAIIALPLGMFSAVGNDPHWAMRSEGGTQLHHASYVAAYLRSIPKPPEIRIWFLDESMKARIYNTIRFPNMEWPALPSGVVTHACARYIVAAVDVTETRNFGVISAFGDSFSERRQWVDYCRGRAVCFADGHAEIVPMELFDAVWARSNRYRQMLGLPPEKLENITYGRFKNPMETVATTRQFVEVEEPKPATPQAIWPMLKNPATAPAATNRRNGTSWVEQSALRRQRAKTMQPLSPEEQRQELEARLEGRSTGRRLNETKPAQ